MGVLVMHKFSSANKHKLESSERRAVLPPFKILKRLGLKEQMVMADIGSGTGYFTLPAAEIVGRKGSVYARDISREMIDTLQMKIKEQGLINIYPQVSSENTFNLPELSIDFVLLSHVLHESYDKALFIAELDQVLKNNGKVAIIEWRKKPMKQGPPLSKRLTPAETQALLKKQSFKAAVKFTMGLKFYALTVRKHGNRY